MKYSLSFSGLLILVAIAVALRGGSDLPAHPQEKKQTQNVKRSIPADEIYTTSFQKGFKLEVFAGFHSQPDGTDKPAFPYSYDLKVIDKYALYAGASNIFLVRGDDISQAIKGTRWIMATGQSADVPPQPHPDVGISSDNFWLVAYLGTSHSTPPNWDFRSVSLQDRTLEFHYRQPKYAISTADGICYFYWIPLGKLKSGVYELKLIDDDEGRPTLARWVTIS